MRWERLGFEAPGFGLFHVCDYLGGNGVFAATDSEGNVLVSFARRRSAEAFVDSYRNDAGLRRRSAPGAPCVTVPLPDGTEVRLDRVQAVNLYRHVHGHLPGPDELVPAAFADESPQPEPDGLDPQL